MSTPPRQVDPRGAFVIKGDSTRPPHWYRVHWCQVCGREERERVYGPKPARPEDRESVTYCGCMNSQFA